MFVAGGCKLDSIQETHRWHCQKINPILIDHNLSVIVEGTDNSKYTNRIFPVPIFHIPILGGWKNYIVLKAESNRSEWHIGWVHLRYSEGFIPRHSVHKLKLTNDKIRMLSLPKGHITVFFAVSQEGSQIPLTKIGEGFLGDNKNKKIRLF